MDRKVAQVTYCMKFTALLYLIIGRAYMGAGVFRSCKRGSYPWPRRRLDSVASTKTYFVINITLILYLISYSTLSLASDGRIHEP